MTIETLNAIKADASSLRTESCVLEIKAVKKGE